MLQHGIPDQLRGLIWAKLLDAEGGRASHKPYVYAKLCQVSNIEDCTQIEKDIDRTLSQLQLFNDSLSAGNNKLFNVLKAYANYDAEIGYIQGMNYIAALMLYYIDDEETVFWCLY